MRFADQLGHWPLLENAREESGAAQDGMYRTTSCEFTSTDGVQGVRFIEDSGIEIALPEQRGGTFTWSVWAHVPAAATGSIGTVASCFDPQTRHGAELGIVHGASTTSHTNVAGVEFSVDWAAEPRWTDLGRPSHAVGVFALAVHDGLLHAGSLGDDGLGRVHVWQDGWTELPGAGSANCVSALASHGGSLYAGTARYRTGGSALDLPANDEPGGEVLRRGADGAWESCGRLPGCDAIAALAVHGGHLYAAALYQEGVWRLGADGWESCGTPGRRLLTLGIHDGRLVGGGNDHRDPDQAIDLTRQGIVTPQEAESGGGGVFALSAEDTWQSLGMQADTTQVYSLTTSRGRLCASTWPHGLVYELVPEAGWVSTGRLGDETEVMGLATYNGSLYGGTLPHAQLYRRDESGWTRVGTLDVTPDALYRRAAGLAVHDGALVVGTLPSGHVHAMRVGDAVTRDSSLEPGWHHLCATYGEHDITVHVDGVPVSRSRRPESPATPLPQLPLVVGSGSRGRFTGSIRNLRVFSRPLSTQEIGELRLFDDPLNPASTSGTTREKVIQP